ncbi:DUF2306 domain-containing protein [Acinetobacter pollinis]|uniref:DUF2306 domain-containing protein n=1 Tax=Acinetobacter pollinis TaxID=2605270 RepID=A0ABU6DY78_9GAMM|nr:DUF2306 domain-containing protein [Acinetobacter pollinis]MEB5477847.1 DUF2306 domain-containing protein [Acinetobacter pollinis]
MYHFKLNNLLNKILLLIVSVITLDFLIVPKEIRRELLIKLIGPEYAVNQLNEFSNNPKIILIHVILGMSFICLFLLQSSSKVSISMPKAHKTVGYIFLIVANLLTLTGTLTAIFYPFSGQASVLPNIFFEILIIIFTIYAIQFARQKKFINHQIYVSRIIAICLGIGFSRILIFILVIIFTIPPKEAFAQAFWFGSSLAFFLNEFFYAQKLYIQQK